MWLLWSSPFGKHTVSSMSKPHQLFHLLCTALKHKTSGSTEREEAIDWLSCCYSNSILLWLGVNWLWTRPPEFHPSSTSVEANLLRWSLSLKNPGGFCPAENNVSASPVHGVRLSCSSMLIDAWAAREHLKWASCNHPKKKQPSACSMLI